MFKVGEAVVLKNSSQNKVMKIQAHNDEFIRAYWSKGEYSFAHESNFRHATPEEIAAGQRIDKSPLMQHLDKCEEVVKTWPKWKLQSVRDAFGIPRHTSEATNEYERSENFNQPEYTLGFFNGAWYAFQHQQSKVDDLQKRVDAAIYLLTSIKAENDLWGCDQVERQIELLEQALKGGSDHE